MAGGDAKADNTLGRLLAGEHIAPGKSPEVGLTGLSRLIETVRAYAVNEEPRT